MSYQLLVTEDDRQAGLMLRDALSRRGFDVTLCDNGQQAVEKLQHTPFDVVLTDLRMPGMSGIDLCAHVVNRHGDMPVVMATAFGSLETAIAAMRAGAYDFVTKPFDIDSVSMVLRRAVEHHQLKKEVKRLRDEIAHRPAVNGSSALETLKQSPSLQSVREMVARLAPLDISILITGESGTGKEVVARAVHEQSQRSGPFMAINCAAVPEHLLESELFGHVRGAFTDARTARPGLLVQSGGGTLFLDEIGELPLALQPKLLRALQERKVRPVGGDTEVPFDARLVVATHRDLELAVKEGRFREDLYFRINVVHLDLPPLRARGSDVLALGQLFINRFAEKMGRKVKGMSPQVAQRLLSYDWPGNVRELQNCMERAVALAKFEQLQLDDLPERIASFDATTSLLKTEDSSPLLSLEELERRHILRVLNACGGSRTAASRTLGIDRKTLYRKLERYAKDKLLPEDEDR